MNAKLYVGNLSPDVGEEDLRLLFSRTGPVSEIQLMIDSVTHQSRGFAFVTMATPELAAAALQEYHCYQLGGRYITVTEARPPQEPKGLMSEGFGHQSSASFVRQAPQVKRRNRSRSVRRHRRA